MKYRSGYKYQLAEDLILNCYEFEFPELITTKFFTLSTNLIIGRDGYAWDGPSGPTLDFLCRSAITPSCGHDIIAQAIRNGWLSQRWRLISNELFRRWCVARNMWKWRAEKWKWALDEFAGFSTDPKNIKKILEAP